MMSKPNVAVSGGRGRLLEGRPLPLIYRLITGYHTFGSASSDPQSKPKVRAMKWFRFYDDVMDNPKLMRIPPETFRFWVVLLCLANRSPVRGTLPDLEEIAFRSRVDVDQARAHIELLVSRRLIEATRGSTYIVSRWEEFQQASDDAASRKRRSREQAKKATPKPPKKEVVTGHVTNLSRDSHGECLNAEEIRGEEKRVEETTPTPSVNPVVVVESVQSTIPTPAKPLRSQSKLQPTPEQIQAISSWTKTLLGGRFEDEYIAGKIPGYCASYPLDWLEGAFLIGKASAPPNQFDRYVNAILIRWHAAGMPSYEEINAAKAGRHFTLPDSYSPKEISKAPPDFIPRSQRAKLKPSPNPNHDEKGIES